MRRGPTFAVGTPSQSSCRGRFLGLPRKGYRRQAERLRSFDYAAPGAYFITVSSWNRQESLGEVMDEGVKLSDEGRIVGEAWLALPRHYPSLALDSFVVMPNHVHGILVLGDVGAGFKPAPTVAAGRSPRRHAIPEIVRAFKTFSARQINVRRQSVGRHVWQRGYYDHVVRDDRDLGRIRGYILTNPLRWSMDQENPLRTEADPFDSWLSGQGSPVPSMGS